MVVNEAKVCTTVTGSAGDASFPHELVSISLGVGAEDAHEDTLDTPDRPAGVSVEVDDDTNAVFAGTPSVGPPTLTIEAPTVNDGLPVASAKAPTLGADATSTGGTQPSTTAVSRAVMDAHALLSLGNSDVRLSCMRAVEHAGGLASRQEATDSGSNVSTLPPGVRCSNNCSCAFVCN